MKILILTHTVRLDSGWGRYSSDLISGIKKSGHSVVVLTEDMSGDHGGILKRGISAVYSALKVRTYIRQCDIVHALDVNPYSIIAWLANLFLRKPFMITIVGSYSVAPFYWWKTKWLVQRACRSARVITAISRYVAEEVARATGRGDIRVVHPGIDNGKFQQDHVLSDQIYFLSVGALKQRKGYHISLAAFAIAKRTFPDLQYVIVGSQRDRGYYERLRSQVISLGVQESVQFLTSISDDELKRLYKGAHVFVLTSVNGHHHFEGYGLVFLEAAAAGVPAIGTRDNGIADAVQEGRTALLVDQNDSEGTAEAMIRLLRDRDLWATMSEQGRVWARSQSNETMVQQYMDIYATIQ